MNISFHFQKWPKSKYDKCSKLQFFKEVPFEWSHPHNFSSKDSKRLELPFTVQVKAKTVPLLWSLSVTPILTKFCWYCALSQIFNIPWAHKNNIQMHFSISRNVGYHVTVRNINWQPVWKGTTEQLWEKMKTVTLTDPSTPHNIILGSWY